METTALIPVAADPDQEATARFPAGAVLLRTPQCGGPIPVHAHKL